MKAVTRVMYLMDAQRAITEATVYGIDSDGPISAANTLKKVREAQYYLDKLAADLEAAPKMEVV